MSHTYTNSFFHLVWSTKRRVPFLTHPANEKVYRYIGGIIKQEKGSLLAIGGMPDHVHVLTSLNKNIALSDFVRKIKSNSSKFLNEEYHSMRFSWQEGYGAFSVSTSMLEIVKKYINNQEEHHQIRSFEEEFIALLKKNGITYDERYLFDK